MTNFSSYPLILWITLLIKLEVSLYL